MQEAWVPPHSLRLEIAAVDNSCFQGSNYLVGSGFSFLLPKQLYGYPVSVLNFQVRFHLKRGFHYVKKKKDENQEKNNNQHSLSIYHVLGTILSAFDSLIKLLQQTL